MTLERLWYGRAPAWQRALGLGLAPLSLLFRGGVAARTLAWDRAWFKPRRVEGLFVVSVGNRLVGGAGKTPLVVFLANWAQRCGHRVAVLSRGFGRASQQELSFTSDALPDVVQVGDEPRLIAQRCPGVTVWVGADRAALAQAARDAGATLALLDDGFQHRRLAREVDLVVEPRDALERLLPWGPFRESRRALGRATLVLSESVPGGGEEDEAAGPPWRSLSDSDAPLAPAAAAPVHFATAPAEVLAPSGATSPCTTLSGRPVVALAGIARPWRFVESLERLGARVVEQRCFGDHHVFTAAELDEVWALARARGADVITTEKDAQRLPPGAPCHVLRQSLTIASGLDRLAAALSLDPELVPPPVG